MSHNHKGCCEHRNMGYCRACDVAYCIDCGREWGRTWTYPAYPYTGDTPWITYTTCASGYAEVAPNTMDECVEFINFDGFSAVDYEGGTSWHSCS